MKPCSQCGALQPLTSFHVDRSRSDGRRPNCRVCQAARKRERRAANRGQTTAAWRRWYAGNAEHRAAYTRENVDRAMQRAHSALNYAIRAGRVAVPEACEHCGGAPDRGSDGRRLLQAHHDDYSRPLDVRWLCSVCHQSEHRAAVAA